LVTNSSVETYRTLIGALEQFSSFENQFEFWHQIRSNSIDVLCALGPVDVCFKQVQRCYSVVGDSFQTELWWHIFQDVSSKYSVVL